MVTPPANVVAEKEGKAASAWQAEQQHACRLSCFIMGEWVRQAYMHCFCCSVTTFDVSLATLDPSYGMVYLDRVTVTNSSLVKDFSSLVCGIRVPRIPVLFCDQSRNFVGLSTHV